MKKVFTRIQSIETPGVDPAGEVIWIDVKAPLDMAVHRMQFQAVLNTSIANPVEVYINTQPSTGTDSRGVTLPLQDSSGGLDLLASNLFVIDARGIGKITDTYYVGSPKTATVVIVLEGSTIE
jgi:hypothetical protein